MLAESLNQVPLFASLPAAEIQALVEGTNTRAVQAGEVIIREGFHNDSMMVLLAGEVEIIKALGTPDERQLAVLGPGSFLGEMGLFTPDGLHTATVRANSPVTLLDLPHQELDSLLLRHPKMSLEVIATLTRRLKQSENLTILDLRKKNRQLSEAYEELKAAQAQIIEKEKLERELEVARGIQTSLLPDSVPTIAGFEFAGYITPMSAVGGDFYDFLTLPDGRIGIVIGDVSDHGVPAALLMALTVTLLRTENRLGTPPAQALSDVNSELTERDHMNMFVTALYGILNPATHTFEYVRAGHNPPILLGPDGHAEEIPTHPGQPLGMLPDPVFDAGSIELPHGSMLLLYTDGVTETMNIEGEMFGTERTKQTMQALGLSASAEDMCQYVHATLRDYRDQGPQSDDVTSLAIKVEGENG
jgi:phosphoserine phosphatase RsbU/P